MKHPDAHYRTTLNEGGQEGAKTVRQSWKRTVWIEFNAGVELPANKQDRMLRVQKRRPNQLEVGRRIDNGRPAGRPSLPASRLGRLAAGERRSGLRERHVGRDVPKYNLFLSHALLDLRCLVRLVKSRWKGTHARPASFLGSWPKKLAVRDAFKRIILIGLDHASG